MMTRRASLPPIVTGYSLDDIWSVIVPKARTNEISNPSLETNTTGYTAGAGSLARSTTQQYHGAYSAAYTPSAATTDGFYYTFTSTIALRAVSCKFLGAAGQPYALAYASTAPAELVTVTFRATGRWQWIWLYVNETSATSRRIYFRKNSSASVATFYVDGVQSEVLVDASAKVSTYIDGDQLGLVPNQNPLAYFWNGTPHASTSTRSGLTRAGGEVVKFKDYGFLLTAIVGLGLAIPQNVATEYARIDGGYDDYTRKPTRQFTLTGRFSGRNYMDLRALRSAIGETLDRDLVAQDQRLVLLHHIEDPCGNVLTNESRVLCKYQGGFGGNTDNQIAETVPLTFTQYLPNVLADNEAGAALSVLSSVANANGILQRSPAGVWSAMGTGAATAGVNTIVIGQNGVVYAGGIFSAMGGVANTRAIAQWSPVTGAWTAMGSGGAGVGNGVTAMAVAPNGDLIVGGDFTGMGGVANTSQLAKWNGSVWSSITGAGVPNGSIQALAFDSLGNLYATGFFTTINGVAANRIAKMDISGVWTALSTGLNAQGISLAIDAADNVYVGGTFTTPQTRIAKWNGSAFSALGSGFDDTVNTMAFDSAGFLYAGGSFLNTGAVSMVRIAKWNGVAWTQLSSGANAAVSNIVWNSVQGVLYVGGAFTVAGGVTFPDAFAVWNGAAFVFPDVDLPASSIVQGIAFAMDGTLYLGFSQLGTATVGSTTQVTNGGSARSYPVIRLTGPTSGAPARVWNVIDVTTNRAIYFNYLMNVGETATLSLQPDNLSFVSNVQGDVMGKIAPGSNVADFFLQPGANSIAFLSADSTMTATFFYRPAYASLDDVN